MATRRSPDNPRSADPASAAEAARRTARSRKPATTTRAAITPEARRTMIAENAYLRAERRGFAPGHETDDWFAAEEEVDALLRAEHGGSPQ